MPVFFVSHFHWDREWYRTMQAFRARLVDAVDLVLDLAAEDDEYRFLLDGQTVVLEDYLAVRPGRADELRTRIGNGQLGIGPWYVQPDSLLPSGEAHVRNLLVGRSLGQGFGPVSSVAYVPDSFGHPAQFPMLFAGFGLDGFVHWRGNGDELDELGARWLWRSPSGAAVRVLLLSEGYFAAARVDDAGDAAADRLAAVVGKLRAAGEEPCVLMNGFDHTRPDRRTKEVVEALAEQLGEPVRRVLLDEVVEAAPREGLASFSGELVGARLANLLAGVWSARMPIKIRNRRIESLLGGWVEPWAAWGQALGLADERPALRLAWRRLLHNQAHDSICGCSTDAVHERMEARFDDAEGLAEDTLSRCLERLGGRPDERPVAWSEGQRLTVFNPSPHRRSDRVRVRIDGDPALRMSVGEMDFHPLTMAAAGPRGFLVGGKPARVVESDDPGRVRWLPDQRAVELELVAEDVPAFGCRTYDVEIVDPLPPRCDSGATIGADAIAVSAQSDGTVDVDFGGHLYSGLFALEDTGDRGDSYDYDPVGEPLAPRLLDVAVQRERHANGIEVLAVTRSFEIPEGLDEGREQRSSRRARCTLNTVYTVAPGVPRVDVEVRLANAARDHRLRALFPAGASAETCRRATTFDVDERSTAAVDDAGWVHPAPSTFCHQGDVAANGLCVVAPGLPEAEVTPSGMIALTLVRSVGWLARYDLRSRPLPAGPTMPAPGAQVLGEIRSAMSLMMRPTRSQVRDARVGLRGVIAGPMPLLEDDRALMELESGEVVLSALKPAEDGDGAIVRLLNETAQAEQVALRFGVPLVDVQAVRLDESADPGAQLVRSGDSVRLEVGAHSARTMRVRFASC